MPFPKVFDFAVKELGQASVSDILQRLIGQAAQSTDVHKSMSRLCNRGFCKLIFTTNYDDLIERTLRNCGEPCLIQTREVNRRVDQGLGTRLIKVHGSQEDWMNIILSGDSYDKFQEHDGWMKDYLGEMLSSNWMIFVGYSFEDPRLLNWLVELGQKKWPEPKAWLCFLTAKSRERLQTLEFEGHRVEELLANTKAIFSILERHEQLPSLWIAAAEKLAPVREEPKRTEKDWSEIRRLEKTTTIQFDGPGLFHGKQVVVSAKSFSKDKGHIRQKVGPPGGGYCITVEPGEYILKISYPHERTGAIAYSTVPMIPRDPVAHSEPIRITLNPGEYIISLQELAEDRFPWHSFISNEYTAYHLTNIRFKRWPYLESIGHYDTKPTV